MAFMTSDVVITNPLIISRLTSHTYEFFDADVLRVGDLIVIRSYDEGDVSSWYFNKEQSENVIRISSPVEFQGIVNSDRGDTRNVNYENFRARRIDASWNVFDWEPAALNMPYLRVLPEVIKKYNCTVSVKIYRGDQIIEPKLLGTYWSDADRQRHRV